MNAPTYWLNGQIVPAEAAVVPVTDHGLLYGDGVFEGIRFYHGRVFREAAHLDRLAASARALRLALPLDRAGLAAGLAELIREHLARTGEQDGYVRLVVTRGPGPLGLDPTGCERPNLFMIATRLRWMSEAKCRDGIDMITAAVRRPSPDVLDPRIKSLNYLNNVFAKLEARAAGVDEALLLNAAGQVAEASVENVFVARGGVLLTPPVSDGALDGITRGVVLELCAAAGIAARERSLTPYDVYTADECFLTGTGAELLPVRALDGRPLARSPGPLFQRLREDFAALVARESGDLTQCR